MRATCVVIADHPAAVPDRPVDNLAPSGNRRGLLSFRYGYASGIRIITLIRRLVESYRLLGVSLVVGMSVGLVVSGFEGLVDSAILPRVGRIDPWLLCLLPGLGLVAGRLLLRFVGGRDATSATADEFIVAYHDRHHLLGWRKAAARMCAAIVTIGSGAPLGLEGPSMYAGATIGVNAHQGLWRNMTSRDRRVLLLSGAAAGVSAIFRAPATGAIFALEVPYQGDFARRMLLPTLVASASGYFTFVAIRGTEPLLPLSGEIGFGLTELLGSIIVGFAAGIAARTFAVMLRNAKRIAASTYSWHATFAVVGLLVATFWVGRAVSGRSITVGSGYEVLSWVLEGSHSLWVLLGVLVLRSLASTLAVAGGGVGGIFIPLVVAGALTGAAVSHLLGGVDLEMFVVVGMAAFLGSGYRVPLAAVMFVAETTGRPSFVVPGLLAAVAAELIMGTESVTPYQIRAEDHLTGP